MRVAARARLTLARRPWIYWAAVVLLAAAAASVTAAQLGRIDAARREWGTTTTALVAAADHEPGDPVRTRAVDLPVAAVPDTALTTLDDDAIATRQLVEGAVLTPLDVALQQGPAASAPAGTAVVAVTDPVGAAVGLPVRVAADGVVLADRATIVGVDGDVAFVAVDERHGPTVAAAAREGLVSLLYLP
jgi:hypothetical protein